MAIAIEGLPQHRSPVPVSTLDLLGLRVGRTAIEGYPPFASRKSADTSASFAAQNWTDIDVYIPCSYALRKLEKLPAEQFDWKEIADLRLRFPTEWRSTSELQTKPTTYGFRSLAESYAHRWLVPPTSAHKPRLDKVATLNALDQLKCLGPNWNGYNATPIDRQVIDAAKRFIGLIPSDIVTTPSVVPMTRGRLQFEWHRGNRSLEIELETRDRIHYLKWDTDEGIEEENTLLMGESDRVRGLLDWFASERVNDR